MQAGTQAGQIHTKQTRCPLRAGTHILLTSLQQKYTNTITVMKDIYNTIWQSKIVNDCVTHQGFMKLGL